jgi:hypothetical protein
MQQRDIETREPLWWDEAKTRPKEQLAVYVNTGEIHPDASEYPEHDGVWGLYFKGKQPMAALKAAVLAAGAKRLAVGGTISVTYIGDGEVTNKAFRHNPPKNFGVTYTPPVAVDPSESIIGAVPGEAMPPGADPAAWAALDGPGRERYAAALTRASSEPPF